MVAFTPVLTCEIQVPSLDEALRWWTEVIGFNELFRADEFGWAEIQSPVSGVTFGMNAGGALKPGSGATLVLGVEDIEAARSELQSKGVAFEGDTVEVPGMVKLATFHDPFGNRFTLAQSIMSPAT